MNVSRVRGWLFALFGVGLAVSISLAQAALALLVIDAVLRKCAEGSPRPSPMEIPILAIIAWSIAVTLVAGSATASKIASAQGAFLLFFLAVRVWSTDDNERWMRWFVIGAAVSGTFAVIQVALNVDRYPVQDQLVVPPWLQDVPEKILRIVALRNERAVGTRSHPLTFGEGMLGAFILLAAAPLWNSRAWRRFRWGALTVVCAGILFSQARGVWLGSLAGSLALGCLWRRRRDVRWVMAAGLLAAFIAVAAVPKIRARALSIVAPSGGQAADQASRNTRFGIWSAALEAIEKNPVAGLGIRGVKLLAPDPALGTMRTWSETHNIYLQITAERGIVGLGLFLWVVMLAFVASARAPAGWRETGIAFLLAFLVAGLTESWTNDKEIAMIFWAIVGAIERRRLAGNACDEEAGSCQ